jgi:hypothetical protein
MACRIARELRLMQRADAEKLLPRRRLVERKRTVYG